MPTETETAETTFAVTIETEMVGSNMDGKRKDFVLTCSCDSPAEARASACFWAGRLTADLAKEGRYKVLGIVMPDGSRIV
jgi:hypothetical protein